jgi:hypothetical protein
MIRITSTDSSLQAVPGFRLSLQGSTCSSGYAMRTSAARRHHLVARTARSSVADRRAGHFHGVSADERTPSAGQQDEQRMVPRLDEATSAAVGKLGEALEWVERARGALYEFHQLSGHADQTLAEAIDALGAAGHPNTAAQLRRELLGRNVLDGRWTFEIVEEYDELYYRAFAEAEERLRTRFTGGRRHVHEARMKAAERDSAGRDRWGLGA